MNVNDIMNSINNQKHNSAWSRGVAEYALELLENLQDGIDGGYFDPDDITNRTITHKALLNGESSWHSYSWDGCSLIYNEDIAERLCTPSELKKTRNGKRKPNAIEHWLDTQGRALLQAEILIQNTIAALNN